MKDLYDSLTIVIVLYNESFNLVSRCLENKKNFKIIIIDNAGNFQLKNEIEKNFKIYKYILNKKNLGFSKGINQGIKICDSEYILNLEADCLIEDKNIYKLYQSHLLYDNCVITTPTMFNESNEITHSGGTLMEKNLGYEIFKIEGDTCVDFPSTAAILFKKKEILDLGLFDEDLFIYYPDCEIGRRINKKKKSIIQVYSASAIHTMGSLKIKNHLKYNFFRNYYFTIDGLIYYYKENLHLPHLKKLKKKIPNYIFKSLLNIFLLRFNKTVEYFSIVMAYYNFKRKFLKN